MTSPAIQRLRSADGVTLAADLYPNEDTDRPVMLLLHGGGQNPHASAATSRALHRAGHSVVAYDARGHGDSDWHPTDLALDLLHVRAQFAQHRPVVAVGASMGGMTILVTHRIAPAELWSVVVLVDVTPRMEIPAFITAKLDDINDDTSDNLERFELLATTMLDGARRITAPTLLVGGALSDIVSADTVAEFMSVVPHAETVDVSGTGHMVAGDDNGAFTTAVLDFLDRLPNRQGRT